MMQIGKTGPPVSHISQAYPDRVEVRGRDLCGDLMGRLSFTEYFHLLLTGREPTDDQRFFLDLLLVAIAEMALAGARGVELEQLPAPLPPHALWFGEDQARYVVAASPDQADAIHKAAAVAKVPLRMLGRVTGDAIRLEGEAPLPLAALAVAHEDWLPRFMAHG
jgi:hypothetical protein